MANPDAPAVGYVLKTFPRLSQTFVVNEIRAHEAAGVRIVVFALKRPRPKDADLVSPPLRSEVVYLSGPPEAWPSQIARIATNRRIRHLHAHFGNIAGETTRHAARGARISYSVTVHAVDLFADRVDRNRLELILAGAKHVVTVSDYNVRFLTHEFGRPALRVNNGLPLDRFAFDGNDRPPGRILCVGRLVPKKGFDVLIDGCRELVRRGIDFDCRIIGEGPLRNALNERIEAHGLSDRVHLLGARTPQQVREAIRQSTVLVAPSLIGPDGDREGLPTVLLEAMALGTPCVGSDVVGIPELIRDGENGLLASVGDSDSVADACARLLCDRALADRVRRRARRTVEADFDARRTSRRLREIWNIDPIRPRRIAFRIHNRRGLGHWMRSFNIARELLRMAPDLEIVFLARATPPFSPSESRLIHVKSDLPDRLPIQQLVDMRLRPDVVVDDTLLPDDELPRATRRALVLRKTRRTVNRKIAEIDAILNVDCLIAPHDRHEFVGHFPDAVLDRAVFVGPIGRQASARGRQRVIERLRLHADEPLLVSTPGGGGFPADFEAFARLASSLHRCLPKRRWRHVFVRGPNAASSVLPVDDRMIVIDSEEEMPSLFSLATGILSAAGYNSVTEIRLAKRPAFFVPGERKFDDQRERVEPLAAAGLAWLVPKGDIDSSAAWIAERLLDEVALKKVVRTYQEDRFELGNRRAAELVLGCLEAPVSEA